MSDSEVKQIPNRHPEFYFSDGSVIFLVENDLYNVHRSILARHSSVFTGMFELPQGNSTQEGLTDGNPVRLPETKSADFEFLLLVLYPRVVGNIPSHSAEAWLSVLTLAQRWDFEEVEELAVRHLDSLVKNPIERIRISQKWNIEPRIDWLHKGYLEFCERIESPTPAEIKCIIEEVPSSDPFDWLSKVIKAREVVQADKRRGYAVFHSSTVWDLLGLPIPDDHQI